MNKFADATLSSSVSSTFDQGARQADNNQSVDQRDEVVFCSNFWKIFGTRPREAMRPLLMKVWASGAFWGNGPARGHRPGLGCRPVHLADT